MTDTLLLKQLQLLIEIGCHQDIVATLMEMSEDFSMHHIQWFAAPIIVHKSLWINTLPKWIVPAIYKDRLEAIFAERETGTVGRLATPAEVLACIYPASYEAPLNHRFSDVYVWAGNEVMTKHNRMKNGQTFWEYLGGSPVAYSSIKYDYEELAADIHRRCIIESKSRGWGSKRKTTKNKKVSSKPTPQFVQTYFF